MACRHTRGGSRGRVQGVHTPPWDNLRFSNTTRILQKKTMWFIGVEVEQETSAPPPKKMLDPPLHTKPFLKLLHRRPKQVFWKA